MATRAKATEAQTVQFPPLWNSTTRVAFRFCFVYFGLYCFSTQIFVSLIPAPNVDIPDPATLWPVRPVILWFAAHVLRIKTPLVYSGSGSGDKTFDYVLALFLLMVASAATAIWSALDRRKNHRRESYVTLHKWFHLFIRFALAGQLLTYGMTKAFPIQMPATPLFRLVEPFGNFSKMAVLWTAIGASRGYEIFAGCAELLGGVLLILPRTSTLGALVSLADMVQVFMLNMSYDVPVKLLSFHLILLSLFLLAPEFQRLANFFVLNRTAGPSTQTDLFPAWRANRVALMAQLAFGAVLLVSNAYEYGNKWATSDGDARPKSALYGIWDVDQMTIDGQVRSPLVTDYDRWRRVIFDYPKQIWFQRMDGSFAAYGAAIDVGNKSIAIAKRSDPNWKGTLHFEQAGSEQLALDGEMDGHRMRMDLKLVDPQKMQLRSRGFHWVQEYPFNR